MNFPRFPPNNYIRIFAIGWACVLGSCATYVEPKQAPGYKSLRPDSSLSDNMYQEVNSYRRSSGKSELQRHSGLDRIAREHSEFMRSNRGRFSLQGKNVTHYGHDNRAILARETYQMVAISENVAAARSPGKNVVHVLLNLWKGSRSHDVNMRNTWTHTGVGIVVDSDGVAFATQIFGSQSSVEIPLSKRFFR